jgi:uncharacterized protein
LKPSWEKQTVPHTNDIPTLASLALQYGTLDQDQYRHLTALHALRKKEKNPIDYGELLLGQKFATRYQIGLLKLIQEYYVIKKMGEEFGRIAVDKGFATELDVQKAISFQKEEFKRARLKKLIGDILVESHVITAKQKENILKEQILLEQRAEKLYSKKQENALSLETTEKKVESLVPEDGSELSDYEKKFLRMKVLDREFAACLTEKGLATEREVVRAQKVQEEEFEKENTLKILGDVMVSMAFITEEQKNIILVDQNRVDTTDSEEKDPGIQVIISPDKMMASIKIDPKFLSQISVSDIKTLLKSHEIKKGTYSDALLQSQLDIGNLNFVVARSDFSSKLLTAKKFIFHLETNLTERGEKRKGEMLAVQDLSPDRLVVKDIFGKEIDQDCNQKTVIRCGIGTRLSQDGASFLAAKTGVPSLSIEGKLFVHPIIHVLEDADLRYGPLEPYANLSISGVLTGAYSITAGTIKAREIRGARIESIGTIRAEVGITDTIIRSQGDIHARYLHNCQIETFGNIYIKNEIYDSKVTCSGMVDSPECRIISSHLFAKKGVKLAGSGSEKTKPCTISSGGEHHLLEIGKSIDQEIDQISSKLDLLKGKKEKQEEFSQKIFQKMIELKIFHDRAKNKKKRLSLEFKKNRDTFDKSKLKNMVKLISNFDARVEKSIASLKEMDKTKKMHDQTTAELEDKINSLLPKTKVAISELEEKLFLFFEWARYQENISKIEISGKAFPGTHFFGIFSSLKISSSMENFSLVEICDSDRIYKLETLQND